MADWRQELHGVLYTSFLPGVMVALTYLILASVLASRPVPTSLAGLDRRVRIEAWWGMGLGLPAVVYATVGGLGDSWHWMGAVLSVGVIASYVVALAALREARLTTWQRSIPAAVAFCGLPAAALAALIDYLPGSDGEGAPLGASGAGLILVFGSYLGLGYLAWCVVGVRFSRAVGRLQRAAPRPPNLPPNLSAPR